MSARTAVLASSMFVVVPTIACRTPSSTGSEKEAIERDSSAEPATTKAEPSKLLPAPVMINVGGTSIAEPTDVEVGAVFEGGTNPREDHFYRFRANGGEELLIEVAKKCVATSAGCGFYLAVLDASENSIVPEDWRSTYETGGFARDPDDDRTIPAPETATTYILRTRPAEGELRYRLRISRTGG